MKLHVCFYVEFYLYILHEMRLDYFVEVYVVPVELTQRFIP